MAEITYQMFLSTLQTVGILVGIVYYITIIRNAQRTREVTKRNRQSDMIIQRSQSYSLDYTRAYAETVGMDDWETVEEFARAYT